MGKPKQAPWRLSPTDVAVSSMNTALGGRRARRQSRELDLRSSIVTLTHTPTGASVQGTVPSGHYSRGEMSRLEQVLRNALFSQLEQKVARQLRIRGR
jgi:hypothetical protein